MKHQDPISIGYWAVIEVSPTERYIVGMDRLAGVALRVTHIDADCMKVITDHGPVYLNGSPDTSLDVGYYWHYYCQQFGIKEWKDVTHEFFPWFPPKQ